MTADAARPETMTTREAAQALGCAERTILLWIQRGTLVARRDGKAWAVDAASVRARAGDAIFAKDTGSSTVLRSAQDAMKATPRSVRDDGKPGDGDAAPAEFAEPHRIFSFRNMILLRKLADLAVQVVRGVASVDGLAPEARRAAIEPALACAQIGCAGYHAFAPAEKSRHYGKAREEAAAAAAALWIVADLATGHAEGLRILAASYERAASALGGLLRKQRKADA